MLTVLHPKQKHSITSQAAIVACMLVLCILSSCNSKNKAPQKKITADSLLRNNTSLGIQDSLQLVQDIDSEDYVALFKNKTNTWLTKVVDGQARWPNFHLVDFWRDDSLRQSAFNPSKDFYSDYSMYLKWSPDSAYIFDMGSYGATIVKDKAGNESIRSGDIDNEAALLNPRLKTKTRLLFFGPYTTPLQAHWVDASQVALLGIFDTTAGQHPDTLLWMINVKTNFFRKYKYARQ